PAIAEFPKETALQWKFENGILTSSQGHRFEKGDWLRPGGSEVSRTIEDLGIHSDPNLRVFLKLRIKRSKIENGVNLIIYGNSVEKEEVVRRAPKEAEDKNKNILPNPVPEPTTKPAVEI